MVAEDVDVMGGEDGHKVEGGRQNQPKREPRVKAWSLADLKRIKTPRQGPEPIGATKLMEDPPTWREAVRTYCNPG